MYQKRPFLYRSTTPFSPTEKISEAKTVVLGVVTKGFFFLATDFFARIFFLLHGKKLYDTNQIPLARKKNGLLLYQGKTSWHQKTFL